MKFKVGDRVKHPKYSDEGKIEHIVEGGIYSLIVKWDDQSRAAYKEIELELVQPEAAKEPDPKGPIPGKYYRTKGGDKAFYIGIDVHKFHLYEIDGEYYRYLDLITSCDDSQFNIIGEWTEETKLPSLEIKRWSLICNEDYKHWKRGEFRFADNSVQEIEKVLNVYVEKEERKYWEIVELTGTLPERKG